MVERPVDGARARGATTRRRDKARALSWSLSKLSAPALAETALNKRLFLRLDAALKHPVVWLQGPPGSGKTTLIASYAAARGLRPIWLRLDEDDGEAATLFFYLSLAEAHARGAPNTRRLPALTPEYHGGAAEFGRDFFRRLFEGPEPRLLVLDDYHEIGAKAAAHECLAAGFREIPAGGNVIVASRAPPPRAFARLRVNGAMEVVAPGELRLTPDEVKEIGRARGMTCDAAQIELADGWPAGLVLLMEAARAGAPIRSGRRASRELLFDYLSREAFERMDERARRNLMRLAFMPTMTSAAALKLTGDPGAGELLESLAARNYFTARDGAIDPHYRFHPLFRDFLLSNARDSLDKTELTAVRRAAAHALAQAGQPEPATALLAEADAWDDLRQLILDWAGALEWEGRHATIAAWIDRLPQDRVEADAWMSYWAGEAKLLMTPAAARPLLLRALDLFENTGDEAGAYLAWAGSAEAVWQDFSTPQTSLDDSIMRMRQLIRRFPVFPSAGIEWRAARSMYVALNRRTDARDEIAHWRDRALAAAAETGEAGILYNVMAHVIVYDIYDGNFARARQQLAALPPLDTVGDAHFEKTHITSSLITAQCHRQAPGSAVATASYALSLENKFAMRAWGSLNASYAARECARIGDLQQARVWLARASDVAEQYRTARGANRGSVNAAFRASFSAFVELAAGDIDAAIAKAGAGVEAYSHTGLLFGEAAARLMFAHALILGGESVRCAEELETVEDVLNRSASECLRFPLELLRVELALRSGDRAAASPNNKPV